jgi:hypothetical protein
MKKMILLVAFFSLLNCSSWAQTNQAEIPKQNVVTPKSTATIPIVPPRGTNQIVRKQITYSGALVQVYKTDNPLQLINPFAPASYGSGYANLSIDLITKKPQGIALFSVNF